MRGPLQTGSGNQDRRHPYGKRAKKPKRKAKGKRPPAAAGPLHAAMVNAAT